MSEYDLKGKNIVLGVCGGIAAYKSCEVVSRLRKSGANVDVIMTKAAQEFVRPLTFETLSNNSVVTDMFGQVRYHNVEHVSLAQKAHLYIIAPATANMIAKIALGLADDFLSTSVMATKAPVLICPAMNTNMLLSPATTANIKTLESRGFHILYGAEGRLACGIEGPGRMAEPKQIVQKAQYILFENKDYQGKKVLITAGGTVENIDNVRAIGNYSSGKMSIELARAAYFRGADVTLICGKISVPVDFPVRRIDVTSTADMAQAVLSNVNDADIIITAAAPADYTPVKQFADKLKDDNITLEFVKTIDIAQNVGKIKGDKKLIIFCAETKDLRKSAYKKLKEKNADMVVANDITLEGAGFGTDTNIVEIIYGDNLITPGKLQKSALSHIILDNIKKL